MTNKLTNLLCFLAAMNACALDDEAAPDESTDTEELSVLDTLGDFNGDGAYDGRDAVAYLRAFGIKLATYATTNDLDNPGWGFARSTDAYSIRAYVPACLANPAPVPPESIPKIRQLASNLSRLPQQYLRELGREGYWIIFSGDLGRFHKRWQLWFDGDGFANEVVIYRSLNGIEGRARFGQGKAFVPGAAWETLANIQWDETAGAYSFDRPAAGQHYAGFVDRISDGYSIGRMDGTMTGPGSQRHFVASGSYYLGGTTGANGFGGALCGSSTGTTPPSIAIGIADSSESPMVHEIGHAIEYMIQTQQLSFTKADVSSLSVFTSNIDVMNGAALPGTGFVSNYAATTPAEDFAETWRFLVPTVTEPTLPGLLQQRIDEDLATNGNRQLGYKRGYVQNVVDHPDPGPAVAIAPNGVTFRARTNRTVQVQRSGVAGSVSSGVTTAVSPALVSNGIDRVWLVEVDTTNAVRYRPIFLDGTMGAWILTSTKTRMPPAAVMVASNVMCVFTVEYGGAIAYRLIDATSGAFLAASTIAGLTTTQPVSAATSAGKTILAALDPVTSNVRTTNLTYYPASRAFAPPVWNNLSKFARSVSLVTARIGSDPEQVYALILDNRFRVQSRPITNPFVTTWAVDPSFMVVASIPAMTATGQVYVRFFDGDIYTKPLAGSSYTRIVF